VKTLCAKFQVIPPPGRWTQHSALNVQKTELHHPAIIPEFQVAPTHNRLLVVCQPWWRFAYLGGYFSSSSAGSDPTFPRHRLHQQNSFQKILARIKIRGALLMTNILQSSLSPTTRVQYPLKTRREVVNSGLTLY
jgi:hypothetical protein